MTNLNFSERSDGWNVTDSSSNPSVSLSLSSNPTSTYATMHLPRYLVSGDDRSSLAIAAMMGVILILFLVLFFAVKLDARCLTAYNRRLMIVTMREDDDHGKEEDMEEKKSYIRSVIQTAKLCREKMSDALYGEQDMCGECANEYECSPLKISSLRSKSNSKSTASKQLQLQSPSQTANNRIHHIIESGEECAICFAPYAEGDVICFSDFESCPHFYHVECMVSWLSRHDSCPSCRQDYLLKNDPRSSGDRNGNANVNGTVSSNVIIVERPEAEVSASITSHSSTSDDENEYLEQGGDGDSDGNDIISSNTNVSDPNGVNAAMPNDVNNISPVRSDYDGMGDLEQGDIEVTSIIISSSYVDGDGDGDVHNEEFNDGVDVEQGNVNIR